MADIAVLHHDLMRKGGGEAVCLEIMRALGDTHDITLFTFRDPDFDELAAYFQMPIPEVRIRRPPLSVLCMDTVTQLSGRSLDLFLAAALCKYARSFRSKSYDLWMSTVNEMPLPSPSIQYVHLPQFDRTTLPGHYGAQSAIQDVYDAVCRRIVSYDRTSVIDGGVFCCNSEFTADIFERVYETRPSVLHPPVDVENFKTFFRPWNERQNGIVSIGRIEPIKGIKDGIEIVDELQERGHEMHYHIAGPETGSTYAQDVLEMATNRPYVTYHGELRHGDTDLLETLCMQRYYLNATQYETFGISLAEMLAAGLIPVVHDSGGQREIVRKVDDCLYTDKTTAVDRLASLANDPERCHTLSHRLHESTDRFSRSNFRKYITDLVSVTLNDGQR
ncbi:glycosyltransferase family 4 protein [Halomicrobium sp. HM KBTZ05]|uniref:glycosyltransferase family 4 protein n=1 Tax=Halomicrobium sp. HM KBTZ05 TaxID=3242663 RepID=UPI003558AC32